MSILTFNKLDVGNSTLNSLTASGVFVEDALKRDVQISKTRVFHSDH